MNEPSTTKHATGGTDHRQEKNISCPECCNTDVYLLGDGRYKCKRCKKKFSAQRTRARIPADKLRALTEHFWSMKTAEQSAKHLGINRKTAQNYYDRLRTNIARDNARALQSIPAPRRKKSPVGGNGKLPVFWSLLHHNRIRIVFPETRTFSLDKKDLPEVQGVSEVYTSSPSALRDVVLDRFYRRTLWARKETDEKCLQKFWRQAKTNLARYRGGCKNKFPLFIEEMAFRFNHHENQGVIRLLEKMINESGSEIDTEKTGR